MQKKLPIFYSALLLTGVNLLLRFVGTSFQVYISRQMGAAGVGLLQLVLSIGSLALIAGVAGIRTSTMYLAAEELGRKRAGNILWVLSGCYLYSILFSGTVAIVLYVLAPMVAEFWIGDLRCVQALRLLAAFLPVTCLCGVMTGYFTAANRIGTLAVVEIGEHLFSMSVTMVALNFWAGGDVGRACVAVVLGSSMGACLTLGCLVWQRLKEKMSVPPPIPLRKRLMATALPLAAADVLKAGINTTENLMVPKRLALNSRVAQPLAAFGCVSGMVFPIMMFPACILFALAELLIPELARCAAAGSDQRIRYLVRRSLKVSMLYATVFSGLIFLLAQPLCLQLYGSEEAGNYLRLYALLIPMLYCDAITDAMTKGLGQQKICVRYNIFTSGLDVVFLYLLLPNFGMDGYFFSFLITHLINFLLSLRRLLKISGERISFSTPALTAAAALGAVWGACQFPSHRMQIISFLLLLGSLLCLFQVTGMEDFRWLRGLLQKKERD